MPAHLPGWARYSFQRGRLRRDPTFRALAGYAHEKGIPYSSLFFPPWEEEDRAILLAVSMDKAQRCPMCGTSEWEHQENPGAYEAVLTTCPGCKMKDEKRSEIDEKMPAGTSITLVPADVAERARKTPRRRPRSPREQARLKRGRR